MVLLVSLQLRKIIYSVSHSGWISFAALWSVKVGYLHTLSEAELKKQPKAKLPVLFTQNPGTEGQQWRMPNLFSLCSGFIISEMPDAVGCFSLYIMRGSTAHLEHEATLPQHS